jgi:hypothetical protein
MENFSNSRSASQRYIPKRNFPMKPMMFLLLGEAFVSCRLSTSGFHEIHVAAVQATREIYLEMWVLMSEISIMETMVAQYDHRPTERPEPVNVAPGTDRNNAGVSRNAGQKHTIKG